MSVKNSTDTITHHETLHPLAERCLEQSDMVAGILGLIVVVLAHGFHDVHALIAQVLALAAMGAMLAPVLSLSVRYVWSLTRSTFLRENAVNAIFCGVWLLGLITIRIFNFSQGSDGPGTEGMLSWTELMVLGRGAVEFFRVTQRMAQARLNPALLLVLSFVTLITIGSLLLTLPRCRPPDQPPADWLTAVFTSTSACCVTGLIVVDTATYWSREGQYVILALIQLGGLGIMTFGAFFAMMVGGGSSVRQAATMRDLLESEGLADVRGMLLSIVGFTLSIEIVGAILLSGLWADRTWDERLFHSVFHSVSAFCNAGFSTRTEGFLHWELYWQVWAVAAGLIILGGLGFTPLDNMRQVLWSRTWFRRTLSLPLSNTRRARLSLSTRLVSITTLALLGGGTLILLGLEWNNPAFPKDERSQIANAWFHSVTLRTAGFNTIDHSQLNPTSKIFGIMMMFVGASPGSTGGGVKTICLALSILTLRAVLKGRMNVEVWGRTIPEVQVYRGLAVIALALTAQMILSLIVISIERRPDLVLDQLYEVGSALGTVGVSTGITSGLQPASKLVLVATMFLGRVGAVTLVAALAGRSRDASYEYPEERIALG